MLSQIIEPISIESSFAASNQVELSQLLWWQINRYKFLPFLTFCLVGHTGSGDGQNWLWLEGQVQHKLAFLADHVPRGMRLILVGHSIGCYMILKMISASTKESLASTNTHQVLKSLLLFPTIERMALSPNGRFFTPVLKYLRWALPLITCPIYFLLPPTIKALLIKWHFGEGHATCSIDGTLKYLSPSVLSNSAYLANQEMQQVDKVDVATIAANIDRLFFYYGVCDLWCPTDYYQSMKSEFPDAEIHLCSDGLEHAFVLRSSARMAEIVTEFLHSSCIINHW